MALIQAVGAVDSGGTIGSGQGWASSASGSTITVWIVATGTGASSVTDNKSNTYTAGTTLNSVTPFYCVNATSGVTSISFTGTTGHTCVMCIEESGISAFDANPAVKNVVSNTVQTSNSITPVSSGEIAYYCVSNSGSDIDLTGTPGTSGGAAWAFITGTGITTGAVNSSGNCGIQVMRAVLSSSSAFNGIETFGTTRTYDNSLIAFQVGTPTAYLPFTRTQFFVTDTVVQF